MAESSEPNSEEVTPDLTLGQAPRITVPVHGLVRYLRSRLEVTDGVLAWEVPRTLLGVMPIGVRHVRVPVADVESARVHKVLHPIRLLIGAACIVVPLVLGLWWVAAPLVIVGVWVIVVTFGPHLEVVTRAGARHRAAVCFAHRIDADLYLAALHDIAAEADQSG